MRCTSVFARIPGGVQSCGHERWDACAELHDRLPCSHAVVHKRCFHGQAIKLTCTWRKRDACRAPVAAGLNMLNQAREFNDAVKLSGLILTKLDGTARGGAVVNFCSTLLFVFHGRISALTLADVLAILCMWCQPKPFHSHSATDSWRCLHPPAHLVRHQQAGAAPACLALALPIAIKPPC